MARWSEGHVIHLKEHNLEPAVQYRDHDIFHFTEGWRVFSFWGFPLHQGFFETEEQAQRWLDKLIQVDAGLSSWD
jgi:hypothetical protein